MRIRKIKLFFVGLASAAMPLVTQCSAGDFNFYRDDDDPDYGDYYYDDGYYYDEYYYYDDCYDDCY